MYASPVEVVNGMIAVVYGVQQSTSDIDIRLNYMAEGGGISPLGSVMGKGIISYDGDITVINGSFQFRKGQQSALQAEINTVSGNAYFDLYHTAGNKNVRLNTNGSSYFMGGNVGIGTTAPLSKLDVNGGLAVGSYAGTSAAPSNGLIVSGNVGINNITPSRKLDITETTSATPQLRLSYNGSNYAEMAVNNIGDLFLDTTGISATNISILDQNLKICAGGTFGSNTCPTDGFNINGTGNLVVAGQVAAIDYQRICPNGYIWVPGSAKYGTMPVLRDEI